MLDVCALLGIEKLNTTSYHTECDGMVERFNRTLKTMLRKRAAQFGGQWDNHLPALLWVYRNTQHDSTGEKLSFLLFGWDCRSPLSTTCQWGCSVYYCCRLSGGAYADLVICPTDHTLQHPSAERRYKAQYDRKTDSYKYKIGDWVLIRFPAEESGRLRKLSRPWHGPYRVTSLNDTNVTAVKVYFPLEDSIPTRTV